jgi:hypothetical protein
MDDVERIIGKLEAFKEFSEKEFAEIKKDIQDLKKFKWQVYGGASLFSFITAILTERLKRLP